MEGGDGKLSLIEVGLREDGEIFSITLTSISQKNVVQTNQALADSSLETKGLPVYYIDGWRCRKGNYADGFHDEFDSEFTLTVGDDYLSLAFKKIGFPVRYIRNEKVRFGLSVDGYLSTIDLMELAEGQMEVVASSI